MACSKYILTNTGSTIVTFNYRRCDDSMWDYQVELEPNQTKNIWLINGTYSTAFLSGINLINLGAFPPTGPTPTPTVTPTNTPTGSSTPTPTPSITASQTNTPTSSSTPTPTPSITASQTQTPTPSTTAAVTPTPTSSETPTPTPSTTASVTPTPTLTPTETDTPARTAFSCCHSETSGQEACDCGQLATIFGANPIFTNNSQFFACPNGPCPGVDLSGWYVNSGVVYELDTTGNVMGFSGCSVTPTPTPTNTVTPTVTSTPTATPAFVVYSLGTGSTSTNACLASPQSIYGSPAQVDGPDFGETLYVNSGLTTPVPNGYYSNGTNWYQVTGGSGVISAGGTC